MADRYDAVAVRRYKDRDGNEKSAFTTVGTAFALKEKDGYMVKLNAMPAPTDGEFVILLMPPKPRDGNRSSGAPSGGNRQSSFSRDIDEDPDSIPF